MRIGIDARLIRYRRGMGTYTHNLLSAFAASDVDMQFVVLLDDTAAIELVPSDPRLIARVLSPRAFPLWEQIALPVACRREKLDLLHCPANSAPMLPIGRPLLMTVHDVMYLLPESQVPKSRTPYHRAGRLYRSLVVPPAARRAARILTASRHSAADIQQVLGVPSSRISIVPLGIEDSFFRQPPAGSAEDAGGLRRLGVCGRYVFALGAGDPRKNTARIIEAFSRLPSETDEPVSLVLAGLTPGPRSEMRRVAESCGAAGRVTLLDFVSHDDLRLLYRNASLFCFPSLYEGFGYPAVEAQASGTPVIASSGSSIDEVAGDGALKVDPRNTDEITNAMTLILRDKSVRERLVASGKQNCAQYAWTVAGQKLLKVYAEFDRRRPTDHFRRPSLDQVHAETKESRDVP